MTTKAAATDWITLLHEAADRNATVELAPAGESRGWRVRMLAIENETLIVEHPPIASGRPAVREDQDAELRLVEGQSRWSLRCRGLERLKFSLTAGSTVAAIRLGWPTDVQSQQRRAYFRVATTGQDRPELRLWRLEDIASAKAAEEAAHKAWRQRHTKPLENVTLPRPNLGCELKAMTLDFSGGGLCVAIPSQAEPLLQQDPLLWVELAIPNEPLPIICAARVAHCQRKQGLLRVGLSFVFDHHPEHEPFVADALCRAAVAIQRLQLRRRPHE